MYMPVRVYLGAQMSEKISPKSYQWLLCSGGIGVIFFFFFSFSCFLSVLSECFYQENALCRSSEKATRAIPFAQQNGKHQGLGPAPVPSDGGSAHPLSGLLMEPRPAYLSPRQGDGLCTPPPYSAVSLFFLLTRDTLDILSFTFHFPPPFP